MEGGERWERGERVSNVERGRSGRRRELVGGWSGVDHGVDKRLVCLSA